MARRYRIAPAFISSPEILIAAEATIALDVTVQAHILKLLKALCQRRQTAALLITHDLGIAAQICERIAVMYAGRIVETAETGTLFTNPLNPYTRGLLKAVPKVGQNDPLAFVSVKIATGLQIEYRIPWTGQLWFGKKFGERFGEKYFISNS